MNLTLLLLTLLHAPPSTAAPAYEWVNVTAEAPFAPRDGAGALVFEDQLWLLGGWNPHDKANFPRTCNNEVWKSANGVDWQLAKPNTFRDADFDAESDWEGRHTAGYVVFRDKMWIIGGDANQGHYQNDVWHSADGVHWDEVPDTPWSPRHAASVFVFQDALWMVAGNNMQSDVWKLVRRPAMAPAAEPDSSRILPQKTTRTR